MPAMFKILIERFRLNPKPYSKYRTAAAALGYVSEAVSRRSFKGGAGASYA